MSVSKRTLRLRNATAAAVVSRKITLQQLIIIKAGSNILNVNKTNHCAVDEFKKACKSKVKITFSALVLSALRLMTDRLACLFFYSQLKVEELAQSGFI